MSFSSSLCNFLHSPVTSSLLGPNILLSTPFSNTRSLRSSLFRQISRQNQNTHFVFGNFFSENHAVYDNVEKYGRARQATDDNIVRRMRVGRWIPKAADTHSEYTILPAVGWAPGPVWTDGNSRPHWDSIPGRPARSSVAIPTELPGPQCMLLGR